MMGKDKIFKIKILRRREVWMKALLTLGGIMECSKTCVNELKVK